MKQLLHVDMIVQDLARSLAFYVDGLGCSVVEDAIVELESLDELTGGATRHTRVVLLRLPGDDDGLQQPMIELLELQPGARPVEHRPGSASGPLPSLFSFGVLVDDIDEVLAELEERLGVRPVTGAQVVRLPRAGESRLVFVRDPDGNLVELVDIPL